MTHPFTKVLGQIEVAIYIVASLLLSAAAFIVFGYAVVEFYNAAVHTSMITGVIKLLENLLLALMLVELLYTVIVSIETRSLMAEPFLVVGLVAAVRRILTISVEGAHLMESDLERFSWVLYEIGLLAVLILILVVSIYILRKSAHLKPDPRGLRSPPAGEPRDN